MEEKNRWYVWPIAIFVIAVVTGLLQLPTMLAKRTPCPPSLYYSDTFNEHHLSISEKSLVPCTATIGGKKYVVHFASTILYPQIGEISSSCEIIDMPAEQDFAINLPIEPGTPVYRAELNGETWLMVEMPYPWTAGNVTATWQYYFGPYNIN